MSTHPPVDIAPERPIAHLQYMLQEVHAELDKCGVPDCGPPAARVAMLAEAFRRRAVKMETEMAELRDGMDAAVTVATPELAPVIAPYPPLATALGSGWSWLTEPSADTVTLLHVASGSHARLSLAAVHAMTDESAAEFARALNDQIKDVP